MEALKKVGRWLAPPPDRAEDGRDTWPSRTAFLLAAMGGCAGMGNLLRYPSQVYNNNGLQWFVPYLMAVFLIAIPALVLEIAIGQAYRGGSVVANNSLNHRLKGAGLSLLYVGFVVGPYFVVNLAWIMNYFRNSFISPLPWTGRGEEFYMRDVVANVDPIIGNLTDNGHAVLNYTRFPGVGMVGETVGWTAFTWFLVWLCIFRGVGLTGRVVYFTMGLPIVVTIILIGRSLSLENACEGVKLMWAQWHGGKLANGEIWQTACGQVFFSTGVGFGYFTSYASYNRKHSNAVVDAIVIVASNVLFENIAAFTVFGVVGFLGLWPQAGVRLGSFTVGFLTIPQAVTEMPGANFWAAALFFTLMVLGFSSAFAMLDAVVTLIMDSGTKCGRALVVTALTVISFLLSLPYCTEFGYYLLEGVDRWTNDVALVFVVFTECVSSTTVYRWHDVVGQVGLPSFVIYNFGYLGGMFIGVAIAHWVNAGAGAAAGLGVYAVCSIISSATGKAPDAKTPKYFAQSTMASRFWWLAFYSGNQLRRDLNGIVGHGNNWEIPTFWAPLLRYISAPVLAIVFSFSYPAFYRLRYEPLHILGFGIGHIALIIIALGFIVPRWFDVLIPPARRGEGHIPYAPGVMIDGDERSKRCSREVESGDSSSMEVPSSPAEK
ncbi:related to sodium- and chloride-dependent GABA transporter 1 [Cephalotrichum gorgonifer]|uniref:Related to sodium- and chloride-dependent GABA transporter 1 n=1 Tax=Cephalotrichum gorgonifer TaxID=2041049 RepID=A0AAE8MU65_9PEZI|nr:related to sodium- and chloride-dependent GABA transporter 1 [Cephalotrichum gorgonifer]